MSGSDTTTTKPIPSPLPPITFKIGGAGQQPYLSIGELTWADVPGFAILTGPNGAGKTHLLELLAYSLTATANPRTGHYVTPGIAQVIGDNFDRGDVAYVPSTWTVANPEAIGFLQMQRAKAEAGNS